MDAVLIKTDGTMRKISPKNGKDFKLKEMYKLLNCERIEVVYPYAYANTQHILICDDEGKINGKAPNMKATAILCCGYGKIFDVIAGDVIYCHTDMVK